MPRARTLILAAALVRLGMRTMAQSLSELVRKGRISLVDAEMSLSDPAELQNLIKAA